MLNEGNNLISTIAIAVYYIIVGLLVLLSLFGVYILVRHGRSRTIALAVSLLYIAIFLSMATASQLTLYSIF